MTDAPAKDDLVSRLRWAAQDAMTKHLSLGMHNLMTEAADEIERCREIAFDEEQTSKALRAALDIARIALLNIERRSEEGRAALSQVADARITMDEA